MASNRAAPTRIRIRLLKKVANYDTLRPAPGARVESDRALAMASLGHIAVGLAAVRLHSAAPLAGRPWLTAAAAWSALSMLPDADVIGFAFGVQYGDEWGHRGATHSFVFSLALGTAIGLVAPRMI